MQNTTVYLIRHGKVEYKTDSSGRALIYGFDVKLSNLGIDQMEKLCRKLLGMGVHLDSLYTSPLPRTVESAEILQGKFNDVPIIKEEGLRDIYTPGAVGRLLDDDIKGRLKPPLSSSDESFQEVAKRVWHTFERIVDQEQGRTIAIVWHGHPIRAIIYLLSNPEVRVDIGNLMPDIASLQRYDYLANGEAWRFILDPNKRVVSSEFITTREGRSPNRERED